MDDSFDKLNNEFADKARGGPKYWIWLIISYMFGVAGIVVGIYSLLPEHNRYLSLLTLLGGLFGIQVSTWSKGTQKRNLPLKITLWGNIGVCALACVILYIILPFTH